MFAALLSAAMMTPAAPVPKDFKPSGPAPYVVGTTLDPDGGVSVLAWRPLVREIDIISDEMAATLDGRVPLNELAELRVTTADGKAVTVREAMRLLSAGTPAVASADGQLVGGAGRGGRRSSRAPWCWCRRTWRTGW